MSNVGEPLASISVPYPGKRASDGARGGGRGEEIEQDDVLLLDGVFLQHIHRLDHSVPGA